MKMTMAAVVSGFLAGFAAAQSAPPAKPDAKNDDKAQVARLYKKNCSTCHGADLGGSASMAKMFKVEAAALNLIDEGTLGKKDEDLSKIIAEGKGKMPAFKGKLKDGEIADLVAYMRSFAPAPSKPVPVQPQSAPKTGP